MFEKRFFKIIVFALILSACSNEDEYVITASDESSFSLPDKLTQTEPQGWIHEFLVRQKSGLTGNIHEAGYPFDTQMWMERIQIDATTEMEMDRSPRIDEFGNKIEEDPGIFWWPYEQTGYYLDGAIKAGYLLNDTVLINRVKKQIYHLMSHPYKGDRMGPAKLIGRWNKWPYTGLFRSFFTEYNESGDEAIVQAMRRHYLTFEAMDFQDELDVTNVEHLLWLFKKTNDSTLLQMAEKSYELFKSDRKNRTRTEKDDIIFESDRIPDQHGVVYYEIVKIPAMLYLATGKKDYLEESKHGIEKIHEHFMLPSGHPSTTEHFDPVSERAGHETCNYGTLPYTYGTLLRATADAKWADRIEKSSFNAAMGAITKDFMQHQYFSAPNQMIATHTSNHFGYYPEFMAYDPGKSVACCTGNINRFMPYYTMHMWMKTPDNGVVAALYGPSTFTTLVGKDSIEATITEATSYPFEEQIDFSISLNEPTSFDFSFRIPEWCKNPQVFVNGKENEGIELNAGFITITREFVEGDKITLSLPMEVEVREWPFEGYSIERGPLVFSLPVKDSTVVETDYDKGSKDFPALSLYPNSNWNLLPDVSNLSEVTIVKNPVSGYPWDNENSPVRIRLKAKKVNNWKLKEIVDIETGELRKQIPAFPESLELSDSEEQIDLVPYGTTLLRVSVFPKKPSMN